MRVLRDAGKFAQDAESPTYVEELRVPDLSVGTYSIPDGAVDDQSPHTEDEIYVVVRGSATLWTPGEEARLGPGDVAFVPAAEEHRFLEPAGDFTTLVVFGPAEYSRAESAAPGAAPEGR
jgi:mannose-6-phosphate isomerase-like protein (cupin superfamily)